MSGVSQPFVGIMQTICRWKAIEIPQLLRFYGFPNSAPTESNLKNTLICKCPIRADIILSGVSQPLVGMMQMICRWKDTGDTQLFHVERFSNSLQYKSNFKISNITIPVFHGSGQIKFMPVIRTDYIAIAAPTLTKICTSMGATILNHKYLIRNFNST